MSAGTSGGMSGEMTMDWDTAVRTVQRFVEAYEAAARGDDFGPLEALTTVDAVAAFLVESHAGTVMPLRSRTAVPRDASIEVDLSGVELPPDGTVVVPFAGSGFARDDFQGSLTLTVGADGLVERARFDAP
jgi:hypothetical protein